MANNFTTGFQNHFNVRLPRGYGEIEIAYSRIQTTSNYAKWGGIYDVKYKDAIFENVPCLVVKGRYFPILDGAIEEAYLVEGKLLEIKQSNPYYYNIDFYRYTMVTTTKGNRTYETILKASDLQKFLEYNRRVRKQKIFHIETVEIDAGVDRLLTDRMVDTNAPWLNRKDIVKKAKPEKMFHSQEEIDKLLISQAKEQWQKDMAARKEPKKVEPKKVEPKKVEPKKVEPVKPITKPMTEREKAIQKIKDMAEANRNKKK